MSATTRLPPPGKHSGLIRELRAEVAVGLCIYCEARLCGQQTICCGDRECLRLYWNDFRRQRAINVRPLDPWRVERKCEWTQCRQAFTPNDPRQRFHSEECREQLRLRKLRAATLRRQRAKLGRSIRTTHLAVAS